MKVSIFISHSCKDKETTPPKGLTPGEIGARRERLRFARGLRDDLHRSLRKVDRFDVFLDVRGALAPGDVWQQRIHKTLATCSGAVILLSPEAIESGWVLKEATILSWRVFIGEPLMVVPVLLGVSEKQLSEKGFAALGLDAIQCVKVPEPTDAARRDVVKQVARAFDRLSAGTREHPWQDTAARWTFELSDQLRSAVGDKRPAAYLREMYRALSMEPDAHGRFAADPFVDIAALVLTADMNQVLRVLYEAGTPNASQREELRERVRTLWVDPDAANPLPFAARTRRVVAIDAESTESARDYILRAYCNRIAADRVLVPSDVNDGRLKEIIVTVERCVAAYLPIESPGLLNADIAQNGPAYVILGLGLARSDVLDFLTSRYPQLTFVAVAGHQWRKRLGTWADKVLLLRPQLQPDRELHGARFRNKLQAFVSRTS